MIKRVTRYKWIVPNTDIEIKWHKGFYRRGGGYFSYYIVTSKLIPNGDAIFNLDLEAFDYATALTKVAK